MDHAATTPMDPAVFAAMTPYLSQEFANPSALYVSGVRVRKAIEEARKDVAHFLGTQPDTIYFTSGGTESNNQAILGLVERYREKEKRPHIITTAIEHQSVLEPMRYLEQNGCDVTYLIPNDKGVIDARDVVNALRKETILVSIMYANNEIGTIEPIADIGRELLKWRKEQGTASPFFHTDACQAAEYLPMAVERLHVDLLTMNGSKIYGPKGVGVLYKRRGIEMNPLLLGGGQERGMRSGTEYTAGIVGLGEAVRRIEREKAGERVSEIRNYFWTKMEELIPDVQLNGLQLNSQRLPNNLHVSFTGCDAEALILYLDAQGFACSAGSACTTDALEPSHVLRACGYTEARSRSSIRFTLGRGTTKNMIDRVMNILPGVVSMIRQMNTSV
ncbi:MAG TPA: cysteine desulfurase family protein [Candidatus Kapabacteria bacterium]|nr:cysteine desulfurase family protein [Candidatus Kapabacteria bacterium]